MVRAVCCVLLAVLTSIAMCSPVKMDMNNKEDVPAAVDELSKFEEGDLIADNKAYIVSSSGNTKISLHDNARLWPGGSIPYKIFESQENSNAYYLTRAAINAINDIQCVTFFEDQNPKGDYINIVLGDSLSSQLGHQRNGAQDLTVPDPGEVVYGSVSIMHALMHSIGFGHEHNRPDREEYVDVKWNNLNEKEKEPYFQIYNSNGNFSTDYLLTYDYQSIMHATSHINSLAVDNNKPVITRKNSDNPEDLGQRDEFTELDEERLKKVYSCEICTGDNNNDIFRYPGDCTQYYVCDNGHPRKMPCGTGLHINIYVDNPYCDYPQNANCTDFLDRWA